MLEVVPLGGLGEFGMNMMAVTYGATTVLVDAGVMFPEPELLGVDLIIPDCTYLQELAHPVSALILTHGHEDHIGAVPHVLPYLDGPIYGSPFTLALLKAKLDSYNLETGDGLKPVQPAQSVQVGDLSVEFIRVTHSMPGCLALAIHTPVGTIVHTGDFKIDQTPLDGQYFDFHRFAELGRSGVLAMFGDSTNIERKGFTGAEVDVIEAFEEIFSSTRGKIVVTAFASSIYRMQILVNLAAQFDRKVAFVGRGVNENSQVAERLGWLRIPAGVQIRESDVKQMSPSKVVCITTGSQGEPLAALSRIAIDDHRQIKLYKDDVVVFSARAIPGNEKAIGRVMNHLALRGADVVYEGIKHVHVSGHGSEEELKLMLSLIRPRFFVPIHGEYRQLGRHARVAERVLGGATTVIMCANGDRLQLDGHTAHVAGKVPAGRVLIDGTRIGEVGDQILRDRRHLAADGLVVPVVSIRRQSGTIEGSPEIITRGFVVDQRTEALLREVGPVLADVINGASLEERTDYGLIKERIRVELQRLIRRRTGTRPLVLPVVMEI